MFVKAGGTLIRRELGDSEKLRISSGCLVAFSNGVDYGTHENRRVSRRSSFLFLNRCFCFFSLLDVEMVKGFANVFAGGEGLFMTNLTGPGTVWLQGQPPERMISEITRRVPSGGPGLVVPVGGGGSQGEGGSGNDSTS